MVTRPSWTRSSADARRSGGAFSVLMVRLGDVGLYKALTCPMSRVNWRRRRMPPSAVPAILSVQIAAIRSTSLRGTSPFAPSKSSRSRTWRRSPRGVFSLRAGLHGVSTGPDLLSVRSIAGPAGASCPRGLSVVRPLASHRLLTPPGSRRRLRHRRSPMASCFSRRPSLARVFSVRCAPARGMGRSASDAAGC